MDWVYQYGAWTAGTQGISGMEIFSVLQIDGRWHFVTNGGLKAGPFANEDEAKRAASSAFAVARREDMLRQAGLTPG